MSRGPRRRTAEQAAQVTAWRGPSVSSTLTEQENPEGLDEALKVFAYLLLMGYLRRRGPKDEQ